MDGWITLGGNLERIMCMKQQHYYFYDLSHSSTFTVLYMILFLAVMMLVVLQLIPFVYRYACVVLCGKAKTKVMIHLSFVENMKETMVGCYLLHIRNDIIICLCSFSCCSCLQLLLLSAECFDWHMRIRFGCHCLQFIHLSLYVLSSTSISNTKHVPTSQKTPTTRRKRW